MKQLWTTEEINFLKGNIGKMKVEVIANKLGRTENAVLLRAKRLKISNTKQTQGDLSLGELASLIHIERRTLYNWVKKGVFPAYKKTTRNKRAFYFVKIEEFWEWAKENKEKLNFSEIKPYAILPEPDWVEAERKRDYFMKKRNYKCWTIGELKSLISLDQDGLECTVIARKLNRTADSVRKKLARIKS